MDLQNISLEQQVNVIFLSKVVKNNLALKKKTKISLFDIHRILQNREAILEVWKEKVEQMKNTTKNANALDALLLEWVRQCKLKKYILSGLLIHEQVKYLTELFKIPYKINKKIWSEVKTILAEDFNSKSLTERITIDIYNIFENDGKRLLGSEIYERFLEILDVKAIKKSSRKLTSSKISPKKKVSAAKERKINEQKVNNNINDDDDVIAVENPITIVDISNDNTEMFKIIANIKNVPLSPPLSDHPEAIKETTFSSKDLEPPDYGKRKELHIKQEPQDYIETEANLEDELNEFDEFLYLSDNSTKTFKLEPDDENTTSLNIKHEPPEIDHDHLNPELNKFKRFPEIPVKQEIILNPKVESNLTEIKSELDLVFMNDNDDNDSECIEIYQIVESDEDDVEEQENPSQIFNKNENSNELINNESVKSDKKKLIEIEFSDFDCLQIKLEKNCDKSLKQILKEENNKTNNLPEDIKDNETEKEDWEETEIVLEIADSDDDEQIYLKEIINKYAKENSEKCKPENLLRTPKEEEVTSTEDQEDEEEEEECEIVLEIVSDEEDDDDNNESISDFFKSKEIRKRCSNQTALPPFSPCRKMTRLNSNESEDFISSINGNNAVFKSLNHVRDFFSTQNDKKSKIIVGSKQRTFLKS